MDPKNLPHKRGILPAYTVERSSARLLWLPHKAADVQAVEAVQRSFTAHIWEAKGLNYWDFTHSRGGGGGTG